MKQFLKYTLATFVGLMLFSFIGIFLLFGIMGSLVAMSTSTPPTTLKANSVYVIELEGALMERSEDDAFMNALYQAANQPANKTMGLDDLLENIDKAKKDDNIKGIYLKGGALGASYASIQELRNALLDFKESGKFIVAYADSYAQSNYYLATVADKLYLNKHGMLGWNGLYSQHIFYKNFLEKIGVEMQIVKVGTFKSAVEPYILTEMSEANRLQMTEMVNGLWNGIVSDVATARNISVDNLQKYADMAMTYQPEETYAEYGLVDSLLYETDLETIIAQMAGVDKVEFVNHASMTAVPVVPNAKADKVAVIYAVGAIYDSGNEGIVADDMVETIMDVAKDKSIKSVVLRVNSPGGSAYASEQIWHALTLLKKEKPLIVSMGDYAASGGYYISCVADEIVAQPSTLTGSIGIYGMIPNVSKVAGKLGFDFDGVQTNRLSDMETNMLFEGMNTEERALMQGYVNRGYELFVQRCADGRQMTPDAIKAIAEGRVWLGSLAKEKGLVDRLGGLDDAVAVAVEKAGLSEYRVVSYPEKKDFMTRLLEEMSVSAAIDHYMKQSMGEEYKMLQQIKAVAEKPSLQAIMPVYFTIK